MASRRGTADDGTVDGHVWRRHARPLSPPPPWPSPDLRRGATRTAFPPVMSRGCTLAPRGRVGRGTGHRGADAPLHPPPWRPRRGGWGGGGERPPLRWPPAPFHPTPPRGCGSTVAGFGGGGWCHGRTAYCRNAGTVHTGQPPGYSSCSVHGCTPSSAPYVERARDVERRMVIGTPRRSDWHPHASVRVGPVGARHARRAKGCHDWRMSGGGEGQPPRCRPPAAPSCAAAYGAATRLPHAHALPPAAVRVVPARIAAARRPRRRLPAPCRTGRPAAAAPGRRRAPRRRRPRRCRCRGCQKKKKKRNGRPRCHSRGTAAVCAPAERCRGGSGGGGERRPRRGGGPDVCGLARAGVCERHWGGGGWGGDAACHPR